MFLGMSRLAVVCQAQDLGVPELWLLSAIAPAGANRLFLAGDLGQRIFQQPFSWKTLGVDVRGRSTTLKVNYRTSQQIRAAADRLLPTVIRDVAGLEDVRKGTVSVFEGPDPVVAIFPDEASEIAAVAAFLRHSSSGGGTASNHPPARKVPFVSRRRSAAPKGRVRGAECAHTGSAASLHSRTDSRPFPFPFPRPAPANNQASDQQLFRLASRAP
jgi:hypothetical protein